LDATNFCTNVGRRNNI